MLFRMRQKQQCWSKAFKAGTGNKNKINKIVLCRQERYMNDSADTNQKTEASTQTSAAPVLSLGKLSFINSVKVLAYIWVTMIYNTRAIVVFYAVYRDFTDIDSLYHSELHLWYGLNLVIVALSEIPYYIFYQNHMYYRWE